MRAMLMMCIVVACCIWASAAMAGTAPVPIEGKLWVSGYELQISAYAYYLQGSSDQVTAWPAEIEHADVSPLGDALAHQLTAGDPWTTSGDIWLSSLDGSTQTNLSQVAGLSGINCFPSWSPDASQIAFRHVDPVPGQQPCDTGFEVWVMNADGSNARRVSPVGMASPKVGGWSADGHSLICAVYGQSNAVLIDLDGSNVQTLPNVRGEGADISPDARHVAGTWAEEDTVNGEPGVWRELRVADINGDNPQTLVRQFVNHSDAQAMVARLGLDTSERDWAADLEWWAGPLFPQWSPKGNRIAFLAALPFDPDGPDYRQQVEVWIYTLSDGDLTRITNDLKFDTWLSWQGENTYPDSPQVTVDNTTVAFSEVTEPGLTTIILDDSPPALPAPQLAAAPFYQIHTTAQVAGPISVSMTYQDADVPATAQGHLALLCYDDAADQWTNLAVTRDVANNVISGQPAALGTMGLSWPLPASHFSDVSSDPADPYWALWEIEAAYAAGIVAGYTDGTYAPAGQVTRDQMATYIARALAGGDGNVPDFTGTPTFTDVPAGNWALKYVQYAVDQKVVKGYTDTIYSPADPVDRGQMAVFIAREGMGQAH